MAFDLKVIAEYADGIGVHKNLILPREKGGRLGEPTLLVERAHALGLVVHAWTFRNENTFLPRALRSGGGDGGYGAALAEYELFFALGVDGVFSDHPDTALEARQDTRVGAQRAS